MWLAWWGVSDRNLKCFLASSYALFLLLVVDVITRPVCKPSEIWTLTKWAFFCVSSTCITYSFTIRGRPSILWDRLMKFTFARKGNWAAERESVLFQVRKQSLTKLETGTSPPRRGVGTPRCFWQLEAPMMGRVPTMYLGKKLSIHVSGEMWSGCCWCFVLTPRTFGFFYWTDIYPRESPWLMITSFKSCFQPRKFLFSFLSLRIPNSPRFISFCIWVLTFPKGPSLWLQTHAKSDVLNETGEVALTS